MPPFSKALAEEGAQIDGFKLVRAGIFDEEGVASLLAHSKTLPRHFLDTSSTLPRHFLDTSSPLPRRTSSSGASLDTSSTLP